MSNLNGVYSHTALNTSEIPQPELNIAKKLRSNPFPWTGQFSPQLVEVLIKAYAQNNSTVLDPFLGSGTLLLEAGKRGLKAWGVEINPAAIAVASTYQFINVPLYIRKACLTDLDNRIRVRLLPSLPLFDLSDPSTKRKTTKWELLNLASTSMSIHDEVLINALIVMLDTVNSDPLDKRALASWKKLRNLVELLPYSESRVKVLHADARNIPIVPSSVDLIITSPPYINVFNYHQRHRSVIEDLNWNPLSIAQSEFGANRKYRSNRFLTVIQYCLDMYQTLVELKKVCVDGARLIFVMGRESKVRGIPFYNGEIVAEVAHRALGLELVLRQERQFINRFGNNIYEDILHFTVQKDVVDQEHDLKAARTVAHHALSAAHDVATIDVRYDILAALRNIETIMPSPTFDTAKARLISMTSK